MWSMVIAARLLFELLLRFTQKREIDQRWRTYDYDLFFPVFCIIDRSWRTFSAVISPSGSKSTER
jgi:hypothetical protein